MQPEQSQHGTLKNIMQPKKLRKRLHRVKGQHIFMLNQMTMAYLIQNSFLPCSDVRWICSILTSGRSENKQNRNIECVLLTSLNKMEFCWKKDLHWTTTSTTFFEAPAWQTYVPLSWIRKKIWSKFQFLYFFHSHNSVRGIHSTSSPTPLLFFAQKPM